MIDQPDFQQLLEGIQSIPWQAIAGAGRFAYISPQIERLLGHPRSDWYDANAWPAHLHTQDRDKVLGWLAGRGPERFHSRLDFRVCDARGGWVWLQISCIASAAEDGRILLTGVMADVSHHHQQAETLVRINRALKVVNACNTALLQADNEQELLDEICRVSVQAGRFRMAWVAIAQQGPQRRVVPAASYGCVDDYLDDVEIHCADDAWGQGPIGTAIRTGKVSVVNHADKDPRMEPWRRQALQHGYLSSIALPLRDRGQTFGALCIYASEADAFDDEQVELLSRLADNLAYGLTALRDRQQRQRTEHYLEAMYASSPDMIFLYSEDGSLLDANLNAQRMLGRSKDELLRIDPAHLIGEDISRTWMLRTLRRARAGEGQDFELILRRVDGTTFPVEVRLRPLATGGEHDEPWVIAQVRDIAERKVAQSRMATLSMALEQTADAVSISDPSGVIEYVNTAFEQVTGYRRNEAVGKPESLVKSGRHDASFYRRLWDTISRGEPFRAVFINRRKDGVLYHEEKTITPVRDEHGRIAHFVGTGKDITERMATEKRLRYLAHHDLLTGLPNRSLFMDRVAHALSRRPEDQGIVALMFVDLDRFKLINDSLGHDAGDRLLQVVSRRLRTCVRQGDTIARLGGDEFGIILEGLTDSRRAADVARQLIAELSRPVVERDAELFVTLSIGISLAPLDATDAQTLLKHADVAMYRAKESGRDNFQFFSADMSARAARRLSLETELRHAAERGQFRLHYQPQVRLADRKLIGVEALLRWEHPEHGLIEPADFVPVLEETGLIMAVGEWVLRQACIDIQALPPREPPVGLSVNLSSRQFVGGDVAQLIARVLADTGLAPNRLMVEITESLILRDNSHTLKALTIISDMGVGIAIDDFGTGYSALSYLKRFPIDSLKIDRSFIRDISDDPDDAAIVEAVIAMARSLDLLVVAEGVATDAQLAFLEGLGCAVGQGYLFGAPSPLDQALTEPADVPA